MGHGERKADLPCPCAARPKGCPVAPTFVSTPSSSCQLCAQAQSPVPQPTEKKKRVVKTTAFPACGDWSSGVLQRKRLAHDVVQRSTVEKPAFGSFALCCTVWHPAHAFPGRSFGSQEKPWQLPQPGAHPSTRRRASSWWRRCKRQGGRSDGWSRQKLAKGQLSDFAPFAAGRKFSLKKKREGLF